MFQNLVDEAIESAEQQTRHEFYRVHIVPVGEREERPAVLDMLKTRQHRTEPKRCHIGVAGFFNFEIAAITKPEFILLLDNNENQRIFWKEIIKLLAENDNSIDFQNNLMKTIHDSKTHNKVSETNLTIKNINLRLRGKEELLEYLSNAVWFNNPDSYKYLHQMAKEEKIAAATLDIIHDDKRSVSLGNALKKEGIMVDTCYWSNIAQWLAPHDIEDGKVSYVSTKDDVFSSDKGGIIYPSGDFYSEHVRRSNTKKNLKWCSESTEEPPKFEKMLRNISAIGDYSETTHILNTNMGLKPIITMGAPRNLALINAGKIKGTRDDIVGIT